MYARYRGRGLGYVSPVGFADFSSFQTAAIASYPSCPPPFDPTCETPRDAAIASNLNEWHTNPQSCGVIVCNPAGQQQGVTMPSTGSNIAGQTVISPRPGRTVPFQSSGANVPVGGRATGPSDISGQPVTSPRFGRTFPFQSSSAATAPGGTADTGTAPIVIQTQAPPPDTTATTTTAPPDFGTLLSSIPIWGWGLAAIAVILIARPGGKR